MRLRRKEETVCGIADVVSFTYLVCVVEGQEVKAQHLMLGYV